MKECKPNRYGNCKVCGSSVHCSVGYYDRNDCQGKPKIALNEIVAIKKAINALNQVPNFKLNDPDFKSSYQLISALELVIESSVIDSYTVTAA